MGRDVRKWDGMGHSFIDLVTLQRIDYDYYSNYHPHNIVTASSAKFMII